jgi:hypothetical protein
VAVTQDVEACPSSPIDGGGGGASGLHDSLANASTTIKAQTMANTVSNIQNSELKNMP